MSDNNIHPASGEDRTKVYQLNDGKTQRADFGQGPTMSGSGAGPRMGGGNLERTSVTLTANELSTLRADHKTHSTKPDDSQHSVFVLDGIRYVVTKVLSESSGEAQVYLVENEGQNYVLKLYYPNVAPKDEIMRLIWNFHFEFVIKLYGFGVISQNGSLRHYELMEYLEGGTLNEFHLGGDVDKFRRITLACAGALAFCHNNHIIHKDIKPSNFFFRDKEQTQIVLGDFGISTLCDEEEMMHRTTQARTPVYAAPEMYENVIDREVEITQSIDFYSLGITLLYLWLGRNPFLKNERAMMHMKSEGKLPELDQLPDAVNKVIRGLTVVNPDKRWGFEEVADWYNGKEVPIDETSVFLRYKSFVVDPERNIIADNARELATHFRNHKALAIKYLYNRRVSRWLEDCGNSKLATEIDDIVGTRYPLNQEAGYTASLFTLDRSLPYHDVKGRACTNMHDVALSLLKYQSEYSVLLKDPVNTLFLYLECVTDQNVERLRSYFRNDDPSIAIRKMIYEIDSSIPFLLDKPSLSILDVVRSFGEYNCSDDEWRSLIDGRLVAWLVNKGNRPLCEEIRLLTQGQAYSKVMAYTVLYHLDRTVGYDLKSAVTRQQVAELIAIDMQSAQTMDEKAFKAYMSDYLDEDGRLVRYATLHGWTDVLQYRKYCFSLRSKENRERCSTYDWHTAVYKFCAGLEARPAYLFVQAGKSIHTVEELDDIELRYIKSEFRNGSLKQWLSLFYHEDPFKEYVEDYSYERTLEQYLIKIGQYDNSDVYFRRYQTAKNRVKNKMKESQEIFSEMNRQKRLWSLGFIALSAILLVLLLTLGISNPQLFVKTSSISVGVPVGIISMLMAGTWGFFIGNGASIMILSGFVGALTAVIPVAVIKNVGVHSSGALMVVCIGFVILYFAIGFLLGRRKSSVKMDDLKGLFKEDINTSLLEPLNYAFKAKTEKFNGSNFGALDDAINMVRSTSTESVTHYVLCTCFMAVFVLQFVMFHPKMLNMDVPEIAHWKLEFRDDVEQFKYIE